MKSLFTYILEFGGGTFMTQVISKDLTTSIQDWTEKNKEEKVKIAQIGSYTIKEIKK